MNTLHVRHTSGRIVRPIRGSRGRHVLLSRQDDVRSLFAGLIVIIFDVTSRLPAARREATIRRGHGKAVTSWRMRRWRTFSRSFTCKCTPSRPLDPPRPSGSRPDAERTLIPVASLFVSLRRLSRIFVSFATLSFRMKKTVQISRIVSEIHINETLGLSPSVETHCLNPMLIPIPRLRRQAQREESRSDGPRPVYPFVAVILSGKQALNILNIFHRMHKYSGHRHNTLSLSER